MKILALTDIHAAYRTAEEIIQKETPDILIIGGDLTTVGTVKEAETALNTFQRLSPTLFCIAGNMDVLQHDELFKRLGLSLNARGTIINDVGLFGVSGAPLSQLHTPYEIPEEEIFRRISEGYRQVQSARRKILITHAPPYGTKVDITHSGLHVGSTAVRDFIEEHRPDLVICGHIHESRGQDTLEESVIVNCGPAAQGNYVIVRIDAGTIEAKNEFHFSPSK